MDLTEKRKKLFEVFDQIYSVFNQKFYFKNDFSAQFENNKQEYMSKLIETESRLKNGFLHVTFG